MTIGERIKALREEKHLTLEDVGNIVGVGKSTVRKWETGMIANMKRDKIAKLALALGVTPAFLMGWEDSPVRPKESPRRYVQIPIYASVSAGPGCFAEGNIEGYTSIPDDMAREGDFFGLRVRGSSMDPEIKDQDVVVVKKTNVAEDGDTVVAIVNGDSGFVKRLVKYAEGISLVSINATEYPPMIFTAKQIESLPVTIQGVVVRLIRDLGA
jgi:repressor LexA